MEYLLADLHIHSCYSFDSLLRPRTILKLARRRGLECIAITDHDSLKGGFEAKKDERDFGIKVIPGIEVSTDSGDIIGLGVESGIGSKDWISVIDDIRCQGGIAVLPHPFRHHRDVENIARSVDLIEVWNGRTTISENKRAQDLAKDVGKNGIAGSDAHLGSEIGNMKMVLDPSSWTCREIVTCSAAPPSAVIVSQIIGHIRKGEIVELCRAGFRFMEKNI
jgi:hypothetical protein